MPSLPGSKRLCFRWLRKLDAKRLVGSVEIVDQKVDSEAGRKSMIARVYQRLETSMRLLALRRKDLQKVADLLPPSIFCDGLGFGLFFSGAHLAM